MAAEPYVSVVICTHDRATHLERALASVLAQDLPPEDWEVIVVDNRSRDATRDVVARAGPRVRYTYEDNIGLSHARNTGWRMARGEYVALLDDDAEAEPTWLGAMLDAFTTAPPRPLCVGGRVDPLWEAPRPAWVSEQLVLSLTVADWGEVPHAVTDLTKEWLVGANIAFRRDVLERLGGFPSRLGRSGRRLLSGEEIYLQRRLLADGGTCWYEPRARVRHLVPASRLSREWFRRRYFAQGQSDAVIWHLEQGDAARTGRWRTAAEQLAPVVRAGFGLPGLLRPDDDPARFTDHCGIWWRLGYLSGLLRGA